MAKRVVKAALVVFAAAFWASASNAQASGAHPLATDPPAALSKALSWLPADTETLIVANGPFSIPQPKTETDESRTRVLPKKEINEMFEALPTALVGLPEGLIQKLNGRKAAFAMEGARHFRSPSGLGEMPYEGCDIVVFVADVVSLGEAFMKDSKNVATKFEEIDGQTVAVFHKKLEEEVWTTLVAFPKPNVLVVATSRDYLREVLGRISGAIGLRALPHKLPEWKYINIHAHCWGLRHYDKRQANLDPSSPIGGEKSANFPDDKAVGLVFDSDAAPGRGTTITYISGAKNVLEIVQEGLFPPQSDPDSITDLHIRYREIAPGVVQGSFDLAHSDPVWYFTFMLMAVLGHGVYL